MRDTQGQSYSIRLDGTTGVVRVVHSRGFSGEVYARYRDEFVRTLDQVRATSPSLRILIDRRALKALPSAERIAELSVAFAPEDRVALIVNSSLLKNEARRGMHMPTAQVFMSEHAAWTWLCAYDLPARTAA